VLGERGAVNKEVKGLRSPKPSSTNLNNGKREQPTVQESGESRDDSKPGRSNFQLVCMRHARLGQAAAGQVE